MLMELEKVCLEENYYCLVVFLNCGFIAFYFVECVPLCFELQGLSLFLLLIHVKELSNQHRQQLKMNIDLDQLLEDNPQEEQIRLFISSFQSGLSHQILTKAEELSQNQPLDDSHILTSFHLIKGTSQNDSYDQKENQRRTIVTSLFKNSFTEHHFTDPVLRSVSLPGCSVTVRTGKPHIQHHLNNKDFSLTMKK